VETANAVEPQSSGFQFKDDVPIPHFIQIKLGCVKGHGANIADALRYRINKQRTSTQPTRY
jgi:hypothetical protein